MTVNDLSCILLIEELPISQRGIPQHLLCRGINGIKIECASSAKAAGGEGISQKPVGMELDET